MTRRIRKPRRTFREIADQAEHAQTAATSFVLSPDYVPPQMFNTRDGSYLLVTPDAARALLTDVVNDKWDDHKTGPMLAALEAQLHTMPDDVLELYAQWLAVAIDPNLIEAVLRDRGTPKAKPVTKEEKAQAAAQDILAILPALENDPKFQHRKSNKPKLALICRELLRRGFDKKSMIDAGLNRGTITDAIMFVRAAMIREGKELTPNLALTQQSRRRVGIKERSGSGKLMDELREASYVVAAAAPILAPKPARGKKIRRVGQSGNAFEAFGHNADPRLSDDDEGNA